MATNTREKGVARAESRDKRPHATAKYILEQYDCFEA